MIMCVLLIANKMTNNALSGNKIGGFYPILNVIYVVMICLSHPLIALFLPLSQNTFFLRHSLKQ